MDVNHTGKPASAPKCRMAAFLPALALLAGCTQSLASPNAARKIACSIASSIPAAAQRAGKLFGDDAIVPKLQRNRQGKGFYRATQSSGFTTLKRGSRLKTSFVGPTAAYLAGEIR
jgi:hypothetical protein